MAERPRLLATLRWMAAATFAAATLLYVSLWMVAARYQPDVELGYDSDYLAAEQAQLITRVLPASPAERAGMMVGDHLVAINGQPLADAGYQPRIWSRHRAGDTVQLTLRRPGDAASRIATGVFRVRESRDEGNLTSLVASQIQNVYPLPFVLVGLALLMLRVDDGRAWLVAVVFGGFASTPAFPESLGLFAPAFQPFTRVYQGLLLGLFAPVFYLFFATFPVRSPLDRQLPWLKWAGLALGVPIALASIRTGSIGLPPPLPVWLGEARAEQIAVWWLLGMLTLGAAALAATYAEATGDQTRRKIRVIVWGTAVGLVPNVLGVGISTLMGYREPNWLSALRAAFAFLLPLSLAYAVAKHRVLELPVLLRRGARYVLVQRGFTVLLALMTIGLTLAFSARIGPFLAPLGPTAQPAGIFAGAALGTLLLWGGWSVHRRVSGRIDRAFFRQAYDGRAILQDLADRAARVTDRAELAALLQRHVAAALQPTAMTVYLRDRDDHLVRLAGEWPEAPERLPADWPWLTSFPHRDARAAARGGEDEAPDTNGQPASAPDYVLPVAGRDGRLLGILALGPRRSEEPYGREDTRLLTLVASQAALALDNLSLAEAMAARLEAERRNEYELRIAQDVQQMLLPQRTLPLGMLDYAGSCTQARSVGGDYYDFLDLGPARLGLVIADISGKGMAAALLMANLQAIVRSHASRTTGDLASLLQPVNALFCGSTAPNRFATLCVAVFDGHARTVNYANCGHNPPLLLRADGRAEWLAPTAIALGFFEDWTCATDTRELRPGDVLVMYSDGITEAWSETHEEYGEGRLLDVVRAARHLPAGQMVRHITADVRRFGSAAQSDDWTLIVARVRAD